jgi:hypothetical protein
VQTLEKGLLGGVGVLKPSGSCRTRLCAIPLDSDKSILLKTKIIIICLAEMPPLPKTLAACYGQVAAVAGIVTVTAADFMPAALTTIAYEPAGVPGFMQKSVVTKALPVPTSVVLQFEVWA